MTHKRSRWSPPLAVNRRFPGATECSNTSGPHRQSPPQQQTTSNGFSSRCCISSSQTLLISLLQSLPLTTHCHLVEQQATIEDPFFASCILSFWSTSTLEKLSHHSHHVYHRCRYVKLGHSDTDTGVDQYQHLLLPEESLRSNSTMASAWMDATRVYEHWLNAGYLNDCDLPNDDTDTLIVVNRRRPIRRRRGKRGRGYRKQHGRSGHKGRGSRKKRGRSSRSYREPQQPVRRRRRRKKRDEGGMDPMMLMLMNKKRAEKKEEKKEQKKEEKKEDKKKGSTKEPPGVAYNVDNMEKAEKSWMTDSATRFPGKTSLSKEERKQYAQKSNEQLKGPEFKGHEIRDFGRLQRRAAEERRYTNLGGHVKTDAQSMALQILANSGRFLDCLSTCACSVCERVREAIQKVWDMPRMLTTGERRKLIKKNLEVPEWKDFEPPELDDVFQTQDGLNCNQILLDFINKTNSQLFDLIELWNENDAKQTVCYSCKKFFPLNSATNFTSYSLLHLVEQRLGLCLHCQHSIVQSTQQQQDSITVEPPVFMWIETPKGVPSKSFQETINHGNHSFLVFAIAFEAEGNEEAKTICRFVDRVDRVRDEWSSYTNKEYDEAMKTVDVQEYVEQHRSRIRSIWLERTTRPPKRIGFIDSAPDFHNPGVKVESDFYKPGVELKKTELEWVSTNPAARNRQTGIVWNNTIQPGQSVLKYADDWRTRRKEQLLREGNLELLQKHEEEERLLQMRQ